MKLDSIQLELATRLFQGLNVPTLRNEAARLVSDYHSIQNTSDAAKRSDWNLEASFYGTLALRALATAGRADSGRNTNTARPTHSPASKRQVPPGLVRGATHDNPHTWGTYQNRIYLCTQLRHRIVVCCLGLSGGVSNSRRLCGVAASRTVSLLTARKAIMSRQVAPVPDLPVIYGWITVKLPLSAVLDIVQPLVRADSVPPGFVTELALARKLALARSLIAPGDSSDQEQSSCFNRHQFHHMLLDICKSARLATVQFLILLYTHCAGSFTQEKGLEEQLFGSDDEDEEEEEEE
eukprot:scaffold44658_cov41-Prasinocladus_malaysianus.AAC.1